jgi:hypothetical protein
MSRSFKLQSDEFEENETDSAGTKGDNANYKTDGQVRNISFILPDGQRKFLNYAYLVSVDYFPKKGAIVLIFTSIIVNLEGVRLETLYYDLFYQRVMEVKSQKNRYDVLEENNSPLVSNITFETE